MTDIGGSLTATHREVGSRRIAAGEASTALMRRRYDVPIEDVWDACTDPERISRWFIKPTGDLRAGGTYQLEGNASGEILRCEPPRLLTVTWSYPGRPVDELELRLSLGEDGETVLELEHASVAEVFITNDPQTGTWGIGPGWEAPLDYLEKYLRGELPDAPAAEWWDPTPEDAELANRRGHAWAAVIEATLAAAVIVRARGSHAQDSSVVGPYRRSLRC
jgi:uncharacterized protein YndB with AHSA1/START domain